MVRGLNNEQECFVLSGCPVVMGILQSHVHPGKKKRPKTHQVVAGGFVAYVGMPLLSCEAEMVIVFHFNVGRGKKQTEEYCIRMFYYYKHA